MPKISAINVADAKRHFADLLGRVAYGGETISAGSIIIRQRGTVIHPGVNVGIGKDHTLFALVTGKVQFATKGKEKKKFASVVPPAV